MTTSPGQARLFALRRRPRPHWPFEVQLKAAGLPTPEREVKFCAWRDWCFDYAWTPWRIALEIEGGVFTGGRHVTGVGFTRDCEKYNQAALLGWLLLRATTAMVHDGRALTVLREAFAVRGLE